MVSKAMASNQGLYERDFYAWTKEQAALLRAGRWQDLDIENVAEEIESMGRSERRELISRLKVLLVHLLKWHYQPALQNKSWRNTISEQRRSMRLHLDENPSLKASLEEVMRIAYGAAIVAAEAETGQDVSTFPQACPWTIDQTLEDGWLPN